MVSRSCCICSGETAQDPPFAPIEEEEGGCCTQGSSTLVESSDLSSSSASSSPKYHICVEGVCVWATWQEGGKDMSRKPAGLLFFVFFLFFFVFFVRNCPTVFSFLSECLALHTSTFPPSLALTRWPSRARCTTRLSWGRRCHSSLFPVALAIILTCYHFPSSCDGLHVTSGGAQAGYSAYGSLPTPPRSFSEIDTLSYAFRTFVPPSPTDCLGLIRVSMWQGR
jgi:hypothetical protein